MIYEIYDEAAGGVLVSREEVPDPEPAPIAAGDFIAQVQAMTPVQKADLRAALGL